MQFHAMPRPLEGIVGFVLLGWVCFNPDVEMQHLLSHPELIVEGDGRIVLVISLNVNYPNAASGGNLAQVFDQGGRDALASMFRAHGKVIDIQLPPCPLEFVEFIGDKAADDFLACQCRKGDNMLFPEQTLQVGITRRLGPIGVRVCKGFTEQHVQLANKPNVSSGEAAENEGYRGHHFARAAVVSDGIPKAAIRSGVKPATVIAKLTGQRINTHRSWPTTRDADYLRVASAAVTPSPMNAVPANQR